MNNLFENIPVSVRRRISLDSLQSEVENLVTDSLIPCSYSTVGEFISEVCDIIVNNILDDLNDKTLKDVTPKDKDTLYNHFVDVFGSYLYDLYHNECESINESKMTYVITESQYKKYNLLFEKIDVSDYDDSDFIEVFAKLFRVWVRKNHGDEIGEHPMSYLISKYLDEFIKDYDIEEYRYRTGIAKLASIGRELVVTGKYVLSSLRPNVKFTEKYKKQIEYLVNYLDLPDYIQVVFEEERPNSIDMTYNVDFPTMLITKDNYKFSPSHTTRQFIDSFTNFLGVDFGSPEHGKVTLSNRTFLKGGDEFIAKVFKKQIRPEIKKIDKGSIIHSISVSISNYKLDLKIKFKGYTSWSMQSGLMKEIEKLFENMGFDPNKINVNS